jgi:hypothetical protein
MELRNEVTGMKEKRKAQRDGIIRTKHTVHSYCFKQSVVFDATRRLCPTHTHTHTHTHTRQTANT